MEKIKNKLKYCCIAFSGFFLPLQSKAQFIEEKQRQEAVLPENFEGANSAITQAADFINILLLFIVIASFIGIVIAIVRLITAGGSESSLEKGRKTAIFSIVGLCTAIVGYIMLKIIKYLFLS